MRYINKLTYALFLFSVLIQVSNARTDKTINVTVGGQNGFESIEGLQNGDSVIFKLNNATHLYIGNQSILSRNYSEMRTNDTDFDITGESSFSTDYHFGQENLKVFLIDGPQRCKERTVTINITGNPENTEGNTLHYEGGAYNAAADACSIM